MLAAIDEGDWARVVAHVEAHGADTLCAYALYRQSRDGVMEWHITALHRIAKHDDGVAGVRAVGPYVADPSWWALDELQVDTEVGETDRSQGPFAEAILSGNVDLARAIIDYGSVDVHDTARAYLPSSYVWPSKRASLLYFVVMWAMIHDYRNAEASREAVAMARMLVDKGVDPRRLDDYGESAIDLLSRSQPVYHDNPAARESLRQDMYDALDVDAPVA